MSASGTSKLDSLGDSLEELEGELNSLEDQGRIESDILSYVDEMETLIPEIEEEFRDLQDYSSDVAELAQEYEDHILELRDQLEESNNDGVEEDILDSYLERIEGLLDEYLSDMDQPIQTGFNGLYKSPIINVGMNSQETGQEPESDRDRYKSPEINVGPASTTMPTNSAVDTSRVPGSWDDYSLGGDLSDFEFSGEPEFDSPETYLESRDTGLGEGQTEGSVSVNVSYGGASDDDLAFLNAAS